MAGIRIDLSPPEAVQKFGEIAATVLEATGELTARAEAKLKEKAKELGVHPHDYEKIVSQLSADSCPDLNIKESLPGQKRRVRKQRKLPTVVLSKKTNTEMETALLQKRIVTQYGEAQFIFCPIPAGTFMMGDDQEKGTHKHQVTISRNFYMGKYQVTQKQWQAVMGENPSHFKGADLPVDNVSWDDCQKFIQRLNQLDGSCNYHLPTEAQWEYVCRAGSTTQYCFGDNEVRLGDYAWHTANSGNKTHPVGQKKPNAWGLHDMHGNVCEWCQNFRHGSNVWAWFRDWSTDYPKGALTDPQGPPSGSYRVLRGGSWGAEARFCRSADCSDIRPDYRNDFLGFRLSCRPSK